MEPLATEVIEDDGMRTPYMYSSAIGMRPCELRKRELMKRGLAVDGYRGSTILKTQECDTDDGYQSFVDDVGDDVR